MNPPQLMVHFTGPVLGHELGWGEGRIWLLNTLFNGLWALEMPWSCQPLWQPILITEAGPGDHCHLHGLALEEGSGRLARKHESGCWIGVTVGCAAAIGTAA